MPANNTVHFLDSMNRNTDLYQKINILGYNTYKYLVSRDLKCDDCKSFCKLEFFYSYETYDKIVQFRSLKFHGPYS